MSAKSSVAGWRGGNGEGADCAGHRVFASDHIVDRDCCLAREKFGACRFSNCGQFCSRSDEDHLVRRKVVSFLKEDRTLLASSSIGAFARSRPPAIAASVATSGSEDKNVTLYHPIVAR